ncbi:hypothetical protein AC629_33475 [Bradyrhizobium sp. NAS80.1]|uniref:hypothetical protein n=1 Tax=Bradyrhizobium sp. NAS80.1 TaxID=1680159 RepID=UPI00096563E4|nr:hypothetical protein [Bradyrhizobium sp. NAS80.1]OKO75950.1 hypothetical protein AC629_33475 [Bradyrhizobium sp. NAS80.1]
MSEQITVERLERALAACAYVMVLDGPKLAPIFNRLERELEAVRETEDTVARAKRLLETYRARPPRLSLTQPTAEVARS